MASPGKKSFPLRLDPALYAALERTAAQDFRSVNVQVEVLLREALALFLVLTAGFIELARRRTRSGWKWRWGGDD